MSLESSTIPAAGITQSPSRGITVPIATYQGSTQKIRLNLSIPIIDSTPNKEIVFVCDTSGSMRGTPKVQVLSAVESMEKNGFQFSIINYSHGACTLKSPNVHEQLVRSWYGSVTNFRQAFEEIIKYIRGAKLDVDFVFLTDGQATDRPMDSSLGHGVNMLQLTQHIQNCNQTITFHTFGLGSNHDRNLLDIIRESGTTPGVYNYASTSVGGNEIAEEITTTLNFASRAKELVVNINGKPHLITFIQEDDQLIGETWLDRIPNSIDIAGGPAMMPISLIPVQKPIDRVYQLKRLQHRIYSIRSGDECISVQKQLDEMKTVRLCRAERQNYVNTISLIQRELDTVRSIFVRESHVNQSEIAARLHALAFRGQLNKARRQRTMDKRAIQNTEILQHMEDRLKNLHDSYTTRDPAESAYGDSKCDLNDDIGQLSLSDIMNDAPDDLLVMGLEATRNEIVIDQPVCMSAQLSTTMLSFSIFETGALFKIQNSDQNSTTGTFDYSKLSEVMKGTSNETINACLPIYGSPEHYKRASAMLPLICGLFFTLSETGYHPKQIPTLYAILARLNRQITSDRHRVMVTGYRDFCAALLQDEDVLIDLKVPKKYWPTTIIDRFQTDISSHQKSELPTLDILYGCLLASDSESSIGTHISSSILLTEIIRRKFNDQLQSDHPDIYYPKAVNMVTSDTQSPIVEIKEDPVVEPHFKPPTFEPYQSPSKCRIRVEFDFIPTSLEGYSDIPNLQMTPDEFNMVYYAAVLQGCMAANNERFRTLIEEGCAILDPLELHTVDKLYQMVWDRHNTKQHQLWKNLVEKQQDTETATCVIHAIDEISVFARTLLELKVTHGQNLWTELVDQMFLEGWEYIVQYEDKLALMLSGEYNGGKIIESGVWMAGKHKGSLCRERLQNTHTDLLLKLDEMVVMHHYREKPNNNGHCAAYPLWNRTKAPGYESRNPFDEKQWQSDVDRLIAKWDM
jgi:hypothetical protein